MSEEGEVICENCSSPLTNKLVARTAFKLKGDGWYKDGYSNKVKNET